MILVRLKGGMGNQMFQYAAGRRLALTLGVQLMLDATAYAEGGNRYYALKHLTVDARLAPPGAVDRWLGRGSLRARLYEHFPWRRVLRPVGEKSFGFDSEILTLSDNVYLDGYWQSEGYFADVSNRIRKDFTFRDRLQGPNAELAARIKDCMAVALHVRRGDYVSDARANAWHGVCSVDFYRRCIARIVEICDNPVFFVFSDDLAWARRHLPLPGDAVFVTGNDTTQASEDLRLMSLCHHHIIANSSFSWWGAWLAEQPEQVVLAPKRWFRASDRDDRNLIPARWERVDDAPLIGFPNP